MLARPYEQVVSDLMKATNRKGNPKDWIIISGMRLMDVWGTYDIRIFKAKPTDDVLMIHKKNLYKLIGSDQAKEFWNRKLGIRVPKNANR